MRKRILSILLVIIFIFTGVIFTGCRESEKVSQNISLEADNFNVVRRLAVINCVTDKPEFEMIGRFSIKQDELENQLEVTVEVAPDNYKKHIIGLNQATTMYIVEDINGSNVPKYAYIINYQPESIIPYKIKSVK